ncbi:hypothetical protein LCGC14_1814620 [marine sediment metagenome]|uniref:Uncharacterized protein n=1 Tax=marine sediment metagenome TaxID=412755 RepID=A0A0F9J0J0_9ZZZZ
MKPVTFPEVNKVWAEDQDEYLNLPAYVDAKESISKWRLSWWERVKVLFTGTIWWRQVNFGEDLQPQCPTLQYPFIRQKIYIGDGRQVQHYNTAGGKKL